MTERREGSVIEVELDCQGTWLDVEFDHRTWLFSRGLNTCYGSNTEGHSCLALFGRDTLIFLVLYQFEFAFALSFSVPIIQLQ